MLSETIIVAIISSLFIAVPSFYLMSIQKRKAGADIATQYEQIASRQTKQLQELLARVDEQECKIEALEKAIKDKDKILEQWKAGITLLINQLIANNIKPIWTPEEK